MIVLRTKFQPLFPATCFTTTCVHVNVRYVICCEALVSCSKVLTICWPGKSNEKEIFGSWKVTRGSSHATYFIIKDGNDSTIRVHSCSWSGCTGIKETKVLPSTDYYYPHSNGWFEARNIHSANENVFLKRESKEKLLVVWYKPLNGFKPKILI